MRLQRRSKAQRAYIRKREDEAMEIWRRKRHLHEALEAIEAETTVAQRKQAASSIRHAGK